jgi:hypothetical protein
MTIGANGAMVLKYNLWLKTGEMSRAREEWLIRSLFKWDVVGLISISESYIRVGIGHAPEVYKKIRE